MCTKNSVLALQRHRLIGLWSTPTERSNDNGHDENNRYSSMQRIYHNAGLSLLCMATNQESMATGSAPPCCRATRLTAEAGIDGYNRVQLRNYRDECVSRLRLYSQWSVWIDSQSKTAYSAPEKTTYCNYIVEDCMSANEDYRKFLVASQYNDPAVNCSCSTRTVAVYLM